MGFFNLLVALQNQKIEPTVGYFWSDLIKYGPGRVRYAEWRKCRLGEMPTEKYADWGKC